MGLTRRAFLIGSAAVVGGVAFGVYQYKKPFPNPLEGKEPGSVKGEEGAVTLNPYIIIDQEGVTIITPRAEMGQGIQSALAAMVAEELDIAWEDIRIAHGPASKAYYNRAVLEAFAPYPAYDQSKAAQRARGLTEIPAKFLGLQVTGGSTSVVDGFEKMRHAGASARMALRLAASKQWGVSANGLKTENAYVINPENGEKLSYIELAEKAATVETVSEPKLRAASTWRYLGKSMPRLDMPAKVTGRARFAIDVKQPDMLYATVKMSPHLGSNLKAVDTNAAEKMKGVHQVIILDKGVAVVADNTWRAMQAANVLEPEWESAPYPDNMQGIWEQVETSFGYEPNGIPLETGDFSTGLKDGLVEEEGILQAEYRVPFLAHATMEPMNAVAQMKDGHLSIWIGTQAPTMVLDGIVKLTGLSQDNVSVHTELLGGGFGRRAEIDFALQAVQIAMQTEGRPVNLTWSREEDMRHDFYRPVAVGRFKGIMKEGQPNMLDIALASPSILRSQEKRGGPPSMGPDPLIAEGVAGQPDGIKHVRITNYAPLINVPIGYWRSVGASYGGFFHESFMDEMAHSQAVDPIAMRLKMVEKESPVAKKVIEAVAKMSGWGSELPTGKGRGFAYTLSFGAHTAQVIEVTDTGAGIKIDKVYCAVDVGTALDPRNVEAQIQSGIVYGLSAAMMGEITINDGKVEQSNFHDYDAMRMHQSPEMIVQILENNPSITGVGEPSTPPSMPALANAIFSVTGKRIRELPLNKQINFV